MLCGVPPDADCVAVIVVWPDVNGTAMNPLTSATDGLLLVYENCPKEFIEKTFTPPAPPNQLPTMTLVPSHDNKQPPLLKYSFTAPKISFPIFTQCRGVVWKKYAPYEPIGYELLSGP